MHPTDDLYTDKYIRLTKRPLMLVYSPSITPRLQYICGFIGKELTGTAFRLTDQKEEFIASQGPKISYNAERLSDSEFWLQPHGLLSEKTIRSQEIECFDIHGHRAFFKTGGDHPFDIFAASFYLLSRYEEYLPYQADEYGRYAYGNSIAFKNGFLGYPLVNIWSKEFSAVLQKRFPAWKPRDTSFNFIPTYDIDEAYSYRHKSPWRTTGAVLKAFLKGNWSAIKERRKVLSGKREDPFDSYAWMNALHEQYALSPRYFFLVAKRTGKYDRNILPAEPALQQLIRDHAIRYPVGVHPSWQSGDHTALLQEEKQTVEKAAGKEIISSRQHFIRFTLPRTFRELIAAGIKEDFSMGYGSVNGFRASVASLFYWYDLEQERETNLLLYPFCYMEANSFFEHKRSAAQALEEMLHYYKEVKAVNGTLITIWHNTFLGTSDLFRGWREVYTRFVDHISQNGTVS